MKQRIVIKGEAGETNCKNKSQLNGVDCQDAFSEYFNYECDSFSGDVHGGYMKFKYQDDKLFTLVEYFADRELTNDELEILKAYTSGQMSDGIGEGFEQQPCLYDENDEEIYLSPWFRGQKLTVTQTPITL